MSLRKVPVCIVCGSITCRSEMCVSCTRSYDRMNAKDSTTHGLIAWAARRALAARRSVYLIVDKEEDFEYGGEWEGRAQNVGKEEDYGNTPKRVVRAVVIEPRGKT